MIRNWHVSGDTSTFLPHPGPCVDVHPCMAVRVEKSFFDRSVGPAKVKMFCGVLGGAIRERVAPGKHAERGYYVEAEERVIHAAFMQARSFSAPQGSQPGKMQETGRIEGRRVWRCLLDSEPRLQTSTLCMHQTNNGRARRRTLVQDSTVYAAPQAGSKNRLEGILSCPPRSRPLLSTPHFRAAEAPPQGFSTPEPILTRLTGDSEDDGRRCGSERVASR